jgi:uncharacterized protein YyaL (SSP411 family)
MAHESFEDERTARLMNEHLVNIKVDREERPDVDAIYMEAAQALNGHGGWPLNVFLTPDGRPFFAGTYFPPVSRRGMPGWQEVVTSVAEAYRSRREDVLHNATVLTDYVRRSQALSPSEGELDSSILADALHAAEGQFDWAAGGLGAAPKFPQPLSLEFLMRASERFDRPDALRFVLLTLDRMAAGGIYDQLGGGFHRYSVDAIWLVPHFEKMLYDNALLAQVYLQAYRRTGRPAYRSVVEETLDYLLREMRAPQGGFYAAQDADSEGVEGKYYLWTVDEVERTLGVELGRLAFWRYGVTPAGNFEDANILTAAATAEEIAQEAGRDPHAVRKALGEARRRLLETRSARTPPGTDTKILLSWNALAVRALARAGRALNRNDYLAAARETVDFLLRHLRVEGELVRSYDRGPSDIPAFLEDYAYLLEALLTLYETTFDPSYLHEARELAKQIERRFSDGERGAFYDTQPGVDLVVRPRGFFDNPIPSGNSSSAFGMLRLAAHTGEERFVDLAVPAFRATRDLMARAPTALSYMLSALDFYLSPQVQIAIAGDLDKSDTRDLLAAAEELMPRNAVIAAGPPDSAPLLQGRTMIDGSATGYVCRHFVCQLPVTTPEGLARQLAEAMASPGS